MISVYAPTGSHIRLLQASLPSDKQVEYVRDWAAHERMALRSSCSLVVIETLEVDPATARLVAFKAEHPSHPTVLITDWTPANAKALSNVLVDEIVWLQEVEDQLADAIERNCNQCANPFSCLGLAFEQALDLPFALRTALATLCRTSPPVESVQALAARVGANRRTLSEQWRATLGQSSGLRLQDIIHWLLLLHAVRIRRPGEAWASTAEGLGVHPHTLARWAAALAGRPLSELAREDPNALSGEFRERLIAGAVTFSAGDILKPRWTFCC